MAEKTAALRLFFISQKEVPLAPVSPLRDNQTAG